MNLELPNVGLPGGPVKTLELLMQGDLGSIPGTRSHMLRLRPGKTKKRKEKVPNPKVVCVVRFAVGTGL